MLAAMRAGLPSLEEFSEIRIVPRFNIAPSQHVPVIRINAAGHPQLDLVRWGLIPHFTKGKPKVQPINARAETIATSGMFRQAFEKRRCLVPANGFYEWQMTDDGKRPMNIHRKDDGLFAFAGLWERWRAEPDSEPVDTFTIITTAPNEMMSPIHNRMPVILAERDYARWLDREVSGKAAAEVLRPYDGDDYVAEPISTRINSPRNDDCGCIAPLAE